MRYFRTHRYIHASVDGKITLCNQLISPTHVDTSLWNETDETTFRRRPCPDCQRKQAKKRNIETIKGRQMRLN